MSPCNRAWTAGVMVAAIFASANFGCGGGSSSHLPPQPIGVSLSATTATVLAGTMTQFTATVSNDPSGKGVNWAVSCSAASCGSVQPTSTPSGIPTTYTAPAAAPAADLQVTLKSTSVADTTKTATATITVPAITVSVSPNPASVQINHVTQFTASVNNDPSNGGVTWALSQNGAACSPGCGTVSPSPTATGSPTTYTAPATQPANSSVTLTATSVTDGTKAGSATITIIGIIVSVAPPSASVPSGGTQPFTATVSNDPSNGGVNWSLLVGTRSCRILFPRFCGPVTYAPCSTCGGVAPGSTASGTPTTYTAPAHFTPPRGCFFGVCRVFVGIVIQATSVTNSVAFGRASIVILPISVAVSPTSASVAVNAMQQFTPTVTNDGTNSGVNWTLALNGVSCSPACGTLNFMSTANGAPVTYTAPATVPAFPFITITATSIEDPTKSATAAITITTASGAACGAGSGSESLLKGQYAFMLQGSDAQGVAVASGSFTADGTGKVTTGEEDTNSSSTELVDAAIDPTASFYAVGPDRRGCLFLAILGGGSTYLRFALGSLNSSSIGTKGHIIEFDDVGGSGRRVAGTLKLQNPTSFSSGQFKGNYAVGLVGGDGVANSPRLAVAGTFTSDGVSAITAGNFDIDDAGVLSSNATPASGASFTCCSANGRGTLQISVGSLTSTIALYMISSGDVFLVNSGFGQYAGEAIGIPSSTTFSAASLNGASVLRQTGQSSTGPVVDVGSVSANGTGGFTVADNQNNAGAFTTSNTAFTATVAPNGRVPLTGGATPPVLYLYGQNQGFLVGTDANASFGTLEPQAAGPFSNASFSGAYMLGTESPSANTVTLESGVETPNGSGSATGMSDQSSSAGLLQNQSLNFAYSLSSNGTGNVGSGTTAILVSKSRKKKERSADE